MTEVANDASHLPPIALTRRGFSLFSTLRNEEIICLLFSAYCYFAAFLFIIMRSNSGTRPFETTTKATVWRGSIRFTIRRYNFDCSCKTCYYQRLNNFAAIRDGKIPVGLYSWVQTYWDAIHFANISV